MPCVLCIPTLPTCVNKQHSVIWRGRWEQHAKLQSHIHKDMLSLAIVFLLQLKRWVHGKKCFFINQLKRGSWERPVSVFMDLYPANKRGGGGGAGEAEVFGYLSLWVWWPQETWPPPSEQLHQRWPCFPSRLPEHSQTAEPPVLSAVWTVRRWRACQGYPALL